MQIPVKAAAGALVRHPHTRQAFPQVGDDADPVEIDDSDLHWSRLLRDGDLVPQPHPKGRSSKKDDQA